MAEAESEPERRKREGYERMQRKYAELERRSAEVRFEDAREVEILNIRFRQAGLEALVDVRVDTEFFADRIIYRDTTGSACGGIGGRTSFRLLTVPAYTVAPKVARAIVEMAEEILPRARALGFHKDLDMIIEDRTDPALRIDATEYETAQRLASIKKYLRRV